jgi:hypothetical protein
MTDMPTTTPNPAELAAIAKGIVSEYAEYGDIPRLHELIDQLRDLASGPSAGAVVVAWLHEDGERSIAAKQKALAVADGGASAASVKPYNVPAYAAPAATPPARAEAPEALPVPLVMPRVKSVIWGSAAEGFAGRVWLELVDGGPHVGYRPAEARGALSDEKEVRAAAQTVITARLRFGWSPEVDEAIAVLEKALAFREKTHEHDTDRELLEKAAKAAGYEDGLYGELSGDAPVLYFQSVGLWDPLGDDGDALRLAVKLGMALDLPRHKGFGTSARVQRAGATGQTVFHNDPYEQTRRAIVRAAAALPEEQQP